MSYPINHYNIRALLNTLYNSFHANYHLSNVSFEENKTLSNSFGGKQVNGLGKFSQGREMGSEEQINVVFLIKGIFL